MSKKKPKPRRTTRFLRKAQLLVEGKNDQHVVWALCQQHKVPKTFTVEIQGDTDGGINELLVGIPLRLKSSNLTALGIVVDADQHPYSRVGVGALLVAVRFNSPPPPDCQVVVWSVCWPLIWKTMVSPATPPSISGLRSFPTNWERGIFTRLPRA